MVHQPDLYIAYSFRLGEVMVECVIENPDAAYFWKNGFLLPEQVWQLGYIFFIT